MSWFRDLKRPQVTTAQLLKANEMVTLGVGERLNKHGFGAFVGPHEAESVVREEMDELSAAVHENDDEKTLQELLDVATAAIWAVASMVAGAEEDAAVSNTEESRQHLVLE